VTRTNGSSSRWSKQRTSTTPAQLADVARLLAYRLDQDGKPPSEDERHRRRDLRIRRRDNGATQLTGELTALCAEALQSVLDSLGKPKPAEDGTADPRTGGQRMHDALQDALLLALRSEKLPDCGGVATTILFLMTPEQFQSGAGLVATGHGRHVAVPEALSLLGDSRVMPVVLGKTGEITAYGTTHRIFSENQRLAMIARDHGSSFPGCTEPPSRCQAHHVTDYSITRRTRVDDGTLLCGVHHREHPQRGWTCQMINGIPHWTPPRWIDPSQTPRRNQAMHLQEIMLPV